MDNLGVLTSGSRLDTSADSSTDTPSITKVNDFKVIASKDRDVHAATVAAIKSKHAAQLRKIKVIYYCFKMKIYIFLFNLILIRYTN